jgi:hypothetical protein
MPRTLADDIRDDVSLVFLDTDHFATDDIVYSPVGAPSRSITAIVEQRTGALVDGQHHETTVTLLWVTAAKSSTNGFDDLHVGDHVQFVNQRWDFHQLVSDDGAMVVAQFQRTDITEYGKRPTQL